MKQVSMCDYNCGRCCDVSAGGIDFYISHDAFPAHAKYPVAFLTNKVLVLLATRDTECICKSS